MQSGVVVRNLNFVDFFVPVKAIEGSKPPVYAARGVDKKSAGNSPFWRQILFYKLS
jgi:hypothetical protein